MHTLDMFFAGVLGFAIPFAGFVLGFFFGQKSVRLMPMRTETLQVSERLTVQRMIPEPEKPVGIPVTRETPTEFSPVVPPQFRKMVEDYNRQQAGSDN